MKKVLALIVCVAMLCSLIVITAQADGAAASFANATTVPGGSVTIDMKVLNNPGLAALRFRIADTDGLGATYVGVDNPADNVPIPQPNDAAGTYFWSGSVNTTEETLGTLTITVPNDAELGEYTFTVTADEGCNAALQSVAVASTTFTITVTDKVITGVNVAIDTGLSVGVHVQAADMDGVSITAVDVAGKEFKTITDYEEDEETGDYVFYVNVNPWAMNKDFKVDFTDKFVISGEGENEALDLTQIPATAKDIGILSYCNALLAGSPSEELTQLIADLLAFGKAAQTFQGVAVMELPAGLEPTEAAWEDGDGNPCDFGAFCSENYDAQSISKGNTTASKKFKFDSAKIEFGSKFVVTFTTANNGTATASTAARMVVEDETYSLTGWDFTYALAPTQYAGIDFVLYSSSSTITGNKCWTNNYGPAYYAAYLFNNEEEGSAAIIDLLEAYYLYGVSAEAYVGSLGE